MEIEDFLFGVLVGAMIVVGVGLLCIFAHPQTNTIENIKFCDTNITITHTDKGYGLPYYIVYSENHSYRVLNENKWIYTQANANIGDNVEIKYKSYYDNQGNEVREIINMKSNWNSNCNNKNSCEDKGD